LARRQVLNSKDGGASEWLGAAIEEKRALEQQLREELSAHAKSKQAVDELQKKVGDPLQVILLGDPFLGS
jgi:hypothetical protein